MTVRRARPVSLEMVVTEGQHIPCSLLRSKR